VVVLVLVVAVVVVVDAVVVVVASVVLVAVGDAVAVVELVPVDDAGVPPELPQALKAAPATTRAASSGSIRFMRRCSGIDISGPSPVFSGPLVACQYPGRRHGP
jgi:hypothetical protein